jgi:hypothetical protein
MQAWWTGKTAEKAMTRGKVQQCGWTLARQERGSTRVPSFCSEQLLQDLAQTFLPGPWRVGAFEIQQKV